MSLRAVLYDLDGTLVDSRADLADSVNAMLLRLGLPGHDDRVIWGFIGEGAERLIRRSLGPVHEHRYPEAAPVWREEYGRRLLAKTRLYPGIADVLARPPEARGVLTNKPGGFAREILGGLGVLGAFRAVVGGDEVPRKPDPRGILDLCRQLGADPEHSLLVGDSTVDLATARAAGVPFCAAGWGLGERAALESADYFCEDAPELSGLLQRLAPG